MADELLTLECRLSAGEQDKPHEIIQGTLTPFALSRVVGLGLLHLSTSLRLTRTLSATLKYDLNVEELWQELLQQRMTEQIREKQLPPETAAVAPYFLRLPPSLRCLVARDLPLSKFIVRNTSMGIDHDSNQIEVQWEASVLVVGAPFAGKTWLIHRLAEGTAPERLDKPPFLGCDLRAVFCRVRDAGGIVTAGRIRLWEPSGIARKQALGGYLRTSSAVVVVVNAADRGAPEEARAQLKRVAAAARPSTSVVLCGAHADQVNLQSFEANAILARLRTAAKEAGVDFRTCSARTGDGVEDLFCTLLFSCSQRGQLLVRDCPLLSHEAGTTTNSELLRALLHRR